MSVFTPGYWEKIGHPEAWATLFGSGIVALSTFIAMALAAYLTYHYTRKHSKATHNTQIKVDRLQRDISSLEKLWELLGYMSFGESQHAIVRWREPEAGKKVYSFHYGNLKRFILKEVNEAYFKHHAGLYIPKEIRDQLFDYRGSLIGLYLKYENDETVDDNSVIVLKNKHLVKKLHDANENLNKCLKKELELRYQQLSAN